MKITLFNYNTVKLVSHAFELKLEAKHLLHVMALSQQYTHQQCYLWKKEKLNKK